MSLLTSLPDIVKECRAQYEQMLNAQPSEAFQLVDRMGEPSENKLVYGDNLLWMHAAVKEGSLRGKISLIYIDPPFYSKNNYRAEVRIATGNKRVRGVKSRAYKDRWGRGMEGFLTMLTLRLLFMKDLLAEDGGIVVHLDWRAVHYVKVIMDELFGQTRFVNEIIWTYKSGGASSRAFAKKHDTLLYYAAGPRHYFKPGKEKSYNRAFQPYRFKGVREYKDDIGWYTMVNRRDVMEVDMVGRTSGERTGYATQKPERLIEILLESCTRPGDLCADFFAGSGTLPAVAHRLGRNFIACDSSPLAMAVVRKRLALQEAPFSYEIGESKENGRTAELIVLADSARTAAEERLCQVAIQAYERNCSTLPIEPADRAELELLALEDPLALVDYWCIDTDYDGVSFQSQQCFVRTKEGLEVQAELLVNTGSRVAVKAYDAFGGFAVWEIEI